MKQLPSSINNYIFRFLSHPVADAIRDRVTDFQMFSKQFGSSDLHTFYIFIFVEKKIAALPRILDEMYEQLGVSMGIDSDYFRPSLWQLYENQFRGTFRSTSLSILTGQRFGQTTGFILESNNLYRIKVKD